MRHIRSTNEDICVFLPIDICGGLVGAGSPGDLEHVTICDAGGISLGRSELKFHYSLDRIVE